MNQLAQKEVETMTQGVEPSKWRHVTLQAMTVAMTV